MPVLFRIRASTDSADTELAPPGGVVDTSAEEEKPTSGKEAAVEEKSVNPATILPPRLRPEDLTEGQVLDGVVKHVLSYGCFLDANCTLDVFVHVSDIAPFYLDTADSVVRLGDKVKVELTGVSDRLKGSFIGHNAFSNPNEETSTRRPSRKGGRQRREMPTYTIEEEYQGLVERLLKGGALVKFDDGRSKGFLPMEEIPEVDQTRGSARIEDVLSIDQKLRVRVLRTDERTQRITLTMRSYDDLITERQASEEGFSISDGDEGDVAILSAALKKAGIVREMFAGAGNGTGSKLKQAGEVQMTPSAVEIVAFEEEQAAEHESQTQVAMSEPETSLAPPEEELVEDPTVPAVEPVMDIAESVLAPVVEPIESPAASVAESEDTASEAVTDSVVEPAIEPQEESKTEDPAENELTSHPVEGSVTTEQSEAAPVVAEVEPVLLPDVKTELPDIETAEEPKSIESSLSVTAVEVTEDAETAKPKISASAVKELREMTGAGMMDCKKALTECNTNMAEAVEYLKKKGIAGAAKRDGKVASEGLIASYIHTGSKLGVLIEVNSETDFVARTDAFKDFAEDVAMTIASSPDAVCISPDDYPAEALEKEKELEMNKEDILSKPEAIREKIVTGRLDKIKKVGAVLEQPFIRDQNTTVQTALNELSASLGEKISIRRFERFELGEGLEKKSTDFAAEVAVQIEAKKAEASTKEPEPAEPITTDQEKPILKVSVALVKELREMTGGGMMDCKNALAECDGDLEKAAESLRKKGLAGAAKKASRLASEGVICSYIHPGSNLGIMAEINCETDFVSRGAEFNQLADDIAMQLAACPEVEYVSAESVPKELIDKEIQTEMTKEDLQSKPEEIRQKISEGRVQKTVKTMCFLDQPSLTDTTKTIGDIVTEHIATLGENIKVRRFVRYNLGEGIEKKSVDFAEEVAEQVQKSS